MAKAFEITRNFTRKPDTKLSKLNEFVILSKSRQFRDAMPASNPRTFDESA